MKRQAKRAFTLVELLVTIAIVAMLSSLMIPQLERFREKANAVACMNNLRQVGTAVNLFVADNDNRYPEIDPTSSGDVYGGERGGMLEVLGEYGVTEKTLKCPDDIKGANNFAKFGSSYEWLSYVGGEPKAAPTIYGRRGIWVMNPQRARLARDWGNVHFGSRNTLRGDGNVSQGWR